MDEPLEGGGGVLAAIAGAVKQFTFDPLVDDHRPSRSLDQVVHARQRRVPAGLPDPHAIAQQGHPLWVRQERAGIVTPPGGLDEKSPASDLYAIGDVSGVLGPLIEDGQDPAGGGKVIRRGLVHVLDVEERVVHADLRKPFRIPRSDRWAAALNPANQSGGVWPCCPQSIRMILCWPSTGAFYCLRRALSCRHVWPVTVAGLDGRRGGQQATLCGLIKEIGVPFVAFLLSAVGISLSGTIAPGPITAVTLGKAARSPHVGGAIAVGHVLVELPLMLAIWFGIFFLQNNPLVKAAIGLVGGAFLLWMGLGMLRGAGATQAVSRQVTMSVCYSRGPADGWQSLLPAVVGHGRGDADRPVGRVRTDRFRGLRDRSLAVRRGVAVVPVGRWLQGRAVLRASVSEGGFRRVRCVPGSHGREVHRRRGADLPRVGDTARI